MPRRAPHNQRPRKRTATTVRRQVAPVSAEDQAVTETPTPARQQSPSSGTSSVRPYGARARATQARALPRAAIHLSKAQEYAFVREDLKRLLLTSGILMLAMILLLFVIER